jgi:tRNA threonylcarbamoyladenosine biosynthesis protein TsaE
MLHKEIKMTTEFSVLEIDSVAQQIIAQNLEKVVLFNGQMGAGKTTLINQIVKNLGVNDATGSPTFSLVNEYKTNDNETIFHFDFYRLKSENEALDMGVEDYLYSGNWCFIEWSEKIPNLIPENHTKIEISILENGNRKLTLF